jgi:hypothetical protein
MDGVRKFLNISHFLQSPEMLKKIKHIFYTVRKFLNKTQFLWSPEIPKYEIPKFNTFFTESGNSTYHRFFIKTQENT